MKPRVIAAASVIALSLSACSNMNNTQQRALSAGAIGAAGGAAVGVLTGGVLTGALIGAGAGAAYGALTDDNGKLKK